MLYYKCVTCRTLLANKQIPYQQGLINITMNNELTQEQKDNAKKKLLDDLEVKRPCCRARVLGFVSLIDLIN